MTRFVASHSGAVLALCALSTALAACGRTSEPSPVKASAPAPAASAESVPSVTRLAAPKKIAAIGDVHGDLTAVRTALRMAGAIDDKDTWVGGDMMVVQTGDEIDRGDEDREVLDLFDKLGRDAKAAGGAVIAMVGNHEIMNVEQRFDYVTPKSFAGFVGVEGVLPGDHRVASLPVEARSRAAAFLPGGPYAKMLARRPVAVLVGDTIFVHGGLSPKHVRYGLDRINQEVASWLGGDGTRLPKLMDSESAPTWLRRYSASPDAEDCKTLDETLRLIGAKRMVMGHTVQRGGISSACDGKAWRIDVGMSKAYAGSPEALLIEGDKVSIAGAH